MPWVYNPFTGKLDWTAAGGGGGLPAGITSPGDGALAAAAGTITASRPAFDATQTWNNAGVTFTGWRVNITDTASAAASLLMDLQVGGVSRLSLTKGGRLTVSGSEELFFGPGGSAHIIHATGQMRISTDGSPNALVCLNGGGVSFSGSDAPLFRDAANVIAQRNGTAAQEKRVYGTFTDASNHRRVALGMSTAGAGFLRPEGAGTGASGNTLQISTGAQTVASLPSASTAGAGARLFVTDANATTFAAVVAGGGSNGVPVYSDGTNWRIG